MEIVIKDIDSIESAAEKFLELTSGKRIYAFYGEMGAGKTTFISALCKALGVDDETGSPTFSIINEYSLPGNDKIYHFDCYRLEDPADLLEIGAEDYLYSDNRCFIEWPEIMEFILPEDTINIYLSVDSDTGERRIKF